MYDFPFEQAAPLVNAFLQTLLLLLCPLVIALVLGGLTGLLLFFWCHPLLSRGKKPHPFNAGLLRLLRSYGYLGLLPLLFLCMQRIFFLPAGTAAVLLLSIGATVHFAWHVYGTLCGLDGSILEMALASGLGTPQIIHRVLLPMGKDRLARAFCETALFLLAMGSVAGCVAGGGLAGLAVQGVLPAANAQTWIWCLLLLASLFLVLCWLSARFAKKAGE